MRTEVCNSYNAVETNQMVTELTHKSNRGRCQIQNIYYEAIYIFILSKIDDYLDDSSSPLALYCSCLRSRLKNQYYYREAHHSK